jgi:glycosyltransferase involved in cell wall biosynthesis
MREPLVSFVMSVHNDAATLRGSLRSVLDQTHRSLEAVVVDDGSTDDSAAILAECAAHDARVRVLSQPNGGLTDALIRACEAARGVLIARHDADDWSHPERVADQIALITADERIGFVSCATQYIGPEGEPLTVVSRDGDPEQATRDLLTRRLGPPAHGSVMFRRDVYEKVGGYRREFLFAQDSDLWLRMAEQCWIGYVPAIRYVHRKEAYSTSGARRAAQRRFGELGHLCRAARLNGESEAPWLDEARALARDVRDAPDGTGDANAVDTVNYLLGSQLTRNNDARGRKYLWRVIRSRPWHLRSWARLLQSSFTADPAVSQRRLPE